jgi:polyisoprenoid-binding protein YceI
MMTTIRYIGARALPLLLPLILLAFPSTAAAGQPPHGRWAVLTFDPAKTSIIFSLTGWPHNTHGTFRLKRGLMRVDPATGKMDGSIVVDAASGDSEEPIRDARMRSGILDAGRFPDISFAPQQVLSHGDPQGEFPVKVRGIMSLHGTQHEFTIDARVHRDADEVTIHCNFVIPYVDWGLENPSILMFTVSKNVDLDVTTVAHLSWLALPPSPAHADTVPVP